jgi:DNA modification methylase
MELNKIIQGDSLEVLKTLPDESVDCVITSPPYWALRDYGVAGQLGLEPTFQEYITKLCDMFDEVKRVLKKEGTCWVNIGDTYMGNSSYSEKGRQGFGNDKIGMINKKQWTDPKHKNTKGRLRAREHTESGQIIEKSLCQIPSRFAIEMTNRGWILRNEIIWHKPNCMPSSVKDRFTVDFEKVFFFVKNKTYFFEQQLEKAIWAETDARSKVEGGVKSGGKTASGNYATNKVAYTEGGMKNKRAVWTINTKGNPDAHFATYPEALVEPMIQAGCPKNGIVLDIFMGSGTTGVVAKKQGKNYIGIELNPEYIKIAEQRLDGTTPSMF